MRRLISGALAAAIVFIASGARAEVVATGTFRVLRKRERTQICRAEWEVNDDGTQTIFTERGQGACHGFTEPVSWESQTRVLSTDSRQLRETTRWIYSPDGLTPLKIIRRTFDPDTGTVNAAVVEPFDQGRMVERSWHGIEEVATPTSLLFVVRDSLARRERSGSVHVVTSEPSLYTMRWVVRGIEQLTVPAGTFTSVKVELLIDLGLLSVLRPLLPKLYVWYVAAPPFQWIKYEGLEDGIGSPKVVIERTSPLEEPAAAWKGPRGGQAVDEPEPDSAPSRS